MRDPRDLSRPAPMRRLFVLGLVFVAAILSCGKDVTGPLGAAARYVRGLSFEPVFPPAFQLAGGTASGVVQFSKVRVVLHHSDGSVALDTLVDFPPGADSLTLDLTVKLLDAAPATGEPMNLDLGYINAAGETVFHGGPVSITAAPPPAGGGSNPPVKVPVSYTGPGSTATAVLISPRTITKVAGQTFSFSAVVTDQNGATLPNTPIIWNSLDPSIASIPLPTSGSGVALAVRGTARIVAQLLTGQTDQVTVVVTLPAANIVTQSGSGQTGVVGTALAAPLVVKVAASDGVGVAGTTVNFTVASGGGSVGSASVVSDANGLAQTTFKLGTTVGAQSVTASAAGLSGSPVTFGATATAATATQLVVTTQPSSGVAGTPLSAVVITAEDALGNVATTFTGAVSIAFGNSTSGAVLSGAQTVNAVAGVATFSALSVNKNGTGYTLIASSSGLTGATTSAFDIAVGAPKQLVFTSQPAGASANVAMPAIVVNAQDSQGNPTPSFTGTVTLGVANNPSGGSLGGTTAVSAVGGVATFTGISISTFGAGYTLSASATGLTSATSNPFNISGGVATNITVSGGAGQTGPPSAALPAPVTIKVADAIGNGIAGTTVTFAVLTGGGSVSPTTGVSDATGHVQTTWTLGPGLGAQSISATAGTLTNSPLTINATAATTTATQLKFILQPSNGVAGASLSPITVQARDAGNSIVTSFTGNVTLSFSANPGGSTLGGTTTVAAVAGIAVFNNITLNKFGSGYALKATSGALTQDVSTPTFTIVAGPAANMAIVGGQGQSGLASSLLPTTLQVFVTDANANPVQGTTVNFAIATGGGSLAPTTQVTNIAGVAPSSWTLGATLGAQTVTASSIGLAGSPLTFSATATVLFASKTWTGATDTQWNTASNWAPLGAPLPTDSVYIPLVANLPTISASTTIAGLTTASGATLTLSGGAVTLTDNGVLDVSGGIAGGGNLQLTPVPAVARLMRANNILGAVTISGTYGMNGAVTVTGNVVINSGAVGFNNNSFTVNGNFSTTGTGALTMTNAGDLLTVNGNATFSGSTGSLTAGTILLTGDFVQSVSASSFAASGTNLVQFAGSSVLQHITFSNTGASRFQNVQIANAAGAQMMTNNVVMNGNVTLSAGGITGAFAITIGGTLTDPAGLLQVSTITFNGNATPVSASTSTINSATIVFNNNPTQLQANLTVNGNVLITTGGIFSPNGHTLTTTGAFQTQSGGKLTMTSASDVINVQGSALFAGGSTAGLLTNGTLSVFGDFTQFGGSSSAFQPTAPHLTQINGNFGTSNINFANPDTVMAGSCSLSCFANFTVAKTAGTLTFLSPASASGNVAINAGVTAVNAIGTAGNQHFLLVRGSTTTAAGTNVHVTRFGSFGSLAFDASTVVDTIQFHGTAAQTIPVTSYSNVVIKGTPTLVGGIAGGFRTTGNLSVDGGTLTLGGSGVVVGGNFATVNSGTLVMNNVADTLFVSAVANFAGGAEAGKLTNGALIVFDALNVAAAGQFVASAPHSTVLIGPVPLIECDCASILTGNPKTVTRAEFKLLRDRRAARIAKTRPKLPARSASKAKASAMRIAPSAPIITRVAPKLITPNNPISAQTLALAPLSAVPVTVAFGDTTGNAFGNVRFYGRIDWQTIARVSGNALADTSSDVEGNGRLIVAGTLTGRASSQLLPAAVELTGTGATVFSDSGYFSPDTTIWSGTNQLMPATLGPSGLVGWYNVVVNSPTLRAYSDSALTIGDSLIVRGSGQLRVGSAGHATEIDVAGALITTGTGRLQMNDDPATAIFVSDSAVFNGGGTTGLLTMGNLTLFSGFRQGSATALDAFAASGSHETHFKDPGYTVPHHVTFASPGPATSHFNDVYFGDTITVLHSNVVALGELETGFTSVHTISAGVGVPYNIVSHGADVRDLTFDNVTWTLLDGAGVTDMDVVHFINTPATSTPFTVQRNGAGSMATLTNWNFQTVPSGGGVYINATDTDGATNGFLNIDMTGTSPASNAGLVTLTNGATISGWFNVTSASWTGGAASPNWNNPTNWSSGIVPSSGTDVTIPVTPYMPTTTAASSVHNLTVNAGVTVTVGVSSPLTVNGDLVINPTGKLSMANSVALNLLGSVQTDTAGATGITACGGTTAPTLSGSGSHTVTGKFCKLVVTNGNYSGFGPILIGGASSTGGAGSGLLKVSGGNLDLNSHRVDTDSLITSGSGTISMGYAIDSLVIHGGAGAVPVSFGGGDESGKMTNGAVVLRSPKFQANGNSFNQYSPARFIADTSVSQVLTWTGFIQGAGYGDATFMNNNFKLLSGSQQFSSVTLDASLSFPIATTGSAASIWVGQITDNTSITNGGWQDNLSDIHLYANTTVPTNLRVHSVTLQGGGNVQLSTDFNTSNLSVDFGTGLLLNGHKVKTFGGSFATLNTDPTHFAPGFLYMTNPADSLDLAGGLAIFNGRNESTYLTAGGMSIGGLYQGYDSSMVAYPNADALSFAPSGTRVTLTALASRTYSPVAFATPGASGAGSHFWSVRNAQFYPAVLYTNMVVDSILAGGVTSATTWQSDQPGTTFRQITSGGLANSAFGMTMSSVTMVLTDGFGNAGATFNSVGWSNFPSGYSGALFTMFRATSNANIDLNAFGSITLGAGGYYFNNLGASTKNIVTGSSNGTCSNLTLTPGQHCP